MPNVEALTRPVVGIENRTAQEAFDIMCDRIRATLSSDAVAGGEPVAWLYDWPNEHGSTETSASTQKIASVNCQPASNYRPLYAAPPETAKLLEKVKELEGLLQEADFWIEGALTCKSWSWDADQHEAASDTLARIRAARRVREGGKVDG